MNKCFVFSNIASCPDNVSIARLQESSQHQHQKLIQRRSGRKNGLRAEYIVRMDAKHIEK